MIHYHGTPCGGTREEAQRFLRGRHALVPWLRPEDIAVAADNCQSFCLDNSAFTAWKSGKPIKDWTGYFEWVREWCQHPAFDFAVIPDVIDGNERDNDKLIEQWVNWKGWPKRTAATWVGVPVWHMHESLDRLARLAQGWPRIALGSSGQWATVGTDSWRARMNEAMAVVCDEHGRPLTKLHGLRMLNREVFRDYPLASADSTNAVRNANLTGRFGMYKPTTSGQRMNQIADIIESEQSAACWVASKEMQEALF